METKFLTAEEMLRINEEELRLKNHILELNLLKLRQQVIQLKAKNYELIISLKQKEIEHANSVVESSKLRQKEFINNLKQKYQIKDGPWGYDPDTGEIKE